MKSTSYKVQIKASVNGSLVTPKSIAWIHGNDSCLAMPCYKENDYFVIEIIPDCVGNNCIEGYLTFGSDCDNCEPVYFKRCFCTNSDDCSECEECNQYGICQSKCKDSEFCDENGCSECSDTVKCPCNKVCTNGRCLCPQNMFEKDGCCVECDSSTVLGKCEECVNGVIRQKDCGGACDPLTGDCVGCLTGGDCSGRADGKTCCKDKVCVCCEGTVWDPISQTCIPQPCKDDTECGPCKKCTPEGCKEIECPEGYKCVDGECKYWPCTNTTCANGADCGPDCGCLNGECTPCYLLECSGDCALSLGCECTNGVTCEPVDNCNEYCDGSSPCSDKNCTCYENNCVSCKNFPCVDGSGGCNSYTNCGCSDSGECEGNKECNDKVTLTQKTACSGNGCELTAEFETKGCKCDPIEFRVKNTHSVSCNTFSAGNAGTVFNFQVSMFKNNHAYKNYKTNPYFGDNELVSGKVRAVITHKYKDSPNTFNPAGVTPLPIQNISMNEVPSIIIKEENFKRTVNGKGTIVEVKLVAEGISVANNRCTSYGTTVIKTLTLDFTSSGTIAETCSKINGEYSNEFVGKAVDNKSTRVPLFTFLKSTTGEYASTKFDTSTDVYAKSGWFKKEFGLPQGSKWVSTIKTPANVEGTTVNQLWSNYNYNVNVDCGCEATSATLEALKFCCPLNISHSITECNTKITLQAFEVCSVNGNLSTYNANGYKIPSSSQVNYEIVIIKGKSGETIRKPLTYSGINTIGTFSWTSIDGEPVTSAYVAQVYNGGLLNGEHCAYQLQIPEVNLPNPSIVLDCQETSENAKVTIIQTTGSDPRITNVEFKFGKAPNDSSVLPSPSAPSTFPTIGNYVATLNKNNIVSKGLRVILTYSGGCKKVYELEGCEASLLVNVQGRSTLKCVNGVGAVVEGVPLGFNGTGGITYTLTGGDLASPLTNETGVFNNLPEGDYTMIATQSSTTASNTGTVLGASEPEITMPSTVCPGQTVAITIKAVQGSTFTIVSPTGATLATPTIPASGQFVYGNISTPGNYIVTLTNNPDNKYCYPSSKILPLTAGGQQLTPQIIFEEGSHCSNEPIYFRIFDNGVGATYNISTNGTGISQTTATAVTSGWSGSITTGTAVTSVTLAITGVVGDCNTTTTPSQSISLLSPPVLSNITQNCTGNSHTIQVNATNATTVQIAGQAATNISGNLWERSGIVGITDAQIIASNGVCTNTESITLQSCECPNYAANIIINLPTCGQGTQDISFLAWDPNLIGWNYNLQKLVNGEWTNLSGSNYSGVMANPSPNFTINNQLNVIDTYSVKFTDPVTNCWSKTNFVEAEALSSPTITISGPTTGNTGTPYTFSAQGGVPGVTTYSWSGAGITGTDVTSNPISFTSAGTYTIQVDTLTNGCSSTSTHTIQISASCNTPMNVSIITSGTPGCQTLSANVNGGSGTIIYEWKVDNVVQATTTTYNGEGINAGDTKQVTLFVSSNNGLCYATVSTSYFKCLNGCNCVYNISAVEDGGNTANIPDTAGSYLFQNWYVDPAPANGFKVYAKTISTTTKQCTGNSIPVTVNTTFKNQFNFTGFRYTINGISPTNQVTSIDMINSGVATTQTIPSGNGDTAANLQSYLSGIYGSQCTISYIGDTVSIYIKSTNTGGFDPDGSFVRGGVTQSFANTFVYDTDPAGPLSHIYSTSCGDIDIKFNNVILVNFFGTPAQTGKYITADYNNVSITGSIVPAVNLSQPSTSVPKTKTCTGCN